MQGAQKINDTWEVFGPPNLNDYPPIPIETYPGVKAYNIGNFNADRNLTPEQRREIRKMFQDMIDAGFLEMHDDAKHGPLAEAWIHNYLPISKSDGSFRPVIDYRRLNEHTIKIDCSKAPTMNECQMALAGSHAFSRLDASGYYTQFRVADEDCHKLGILTPQGIAHSKVLGMGMTNASFFAQHNSNEWYSPYSLIQQISSPGDS